jgi:predicted SnoaL-like aldol condensation-catalyzing enzyme
MLGTRQPSARAGGGVRTDCRFPCDSVRVQDGRFAEHWDVREKETTKDESLSGLPMFGDEFPDERRN